MNWTYQRSPNTFLPNINGAYRYSNLTSFINGTPNRIQIAQGNPVLDFREYDTFLYAGDDWKISQNLTLNLGLTWTYYGNPAQLFTDVTNKGKPIQQQPCGCRLCPFRLRTNPVLPTVKNSFGPSAGLCLYPAVGRHDYRTWQDHLRGGYRMLYDPPFYNIFLNMSTASPFGFLQTLTTGLTNPPALPTGPNVRTSLQASLLPNTFDPRTQNETNLSPNFGPDKVHTWSFGFERELTKSAVFEARYVGNHAVNLFQTVDGNPFAGIPGRPGLLQDFPNLIPAGITPCAATQQSPPFPNAGNPAVPTPTDLGRVNCGLGVVRSRNNGGFSDYHAVQTEFRANNLFKQLTLRAGYTFSKNLDNVSEIFATGTAGNTLFAAQNPFQTGDAERSISGLNIPNAFTVSVTENVPFFREQHGLIGHVLGGWAFSASYVWGSGQPYTVQQGAILGSVSFTGAGSDYFDSGYSNAFVGDPARLFYGNRNAPQNTIGIYLGDMCAAATPAGPGPSFGASPYRASLFGTAACTAALATFGPNQLMSVNALNAPAAADARGCIRGAAACTFVPVSTSDVRYIVNGHTAEKIFGTPFGNVARNSLVDAPSNRLDATIFKNIKWGERSNFEMRMTATNALNHFNFGSIDPNVEDAGLTPGDIRVFGAGFGLPAQTAAAGRVLSISGKFTF